MAHATAQKYYIPHGTHWPIIGSVALFTLLIGFSVLLNGTSGGEWLMVAGFLMLVFMMFAGLPPNGYVLINAGVEVEELGLGGFLAEHDPARVITVPATQIAMRHLGRPLPNVVLLGGFAGLTGQVDLVDVEAAAAERFRGAVLEGNRAAAREAFDVVLARKEGVDA